MPIRSGFPAIAASRARCGACSALPSIYIALTASPRCVRSTVSAKGWPIRSGKSSRPGALRCSIDSPAKRRPRCCLRACPVVVPALHIASATNSVWRPSRNWNSQHTMVASPVSRGSVVSVWPAADPACRERRLGRDRACSRIPGERTNSGRRMIGWSSTTTRTIARINARSLLDVTARSQAAAWCAGVRRNAAATRGLPSAAARPGRVVSGDYMPISGGAPGSLCGSSISVIVASVNSRTLATDTAFSSAIRTTFVGSTMPASNRSTY